MATSPAFSAAPLPHGPLAKGLAYNWWLLLLRGLVALLFGIVAFVMPHITLLTVVLLWGAFVAADGMLALIAGLTGKASEVRPRWWLILVGLMGLAAGGIAFFRPLIGAAALLLLVAIWAIVIGASQIIGGIALRREIQDEWWLILSGLLAVVFGAAFLIHPMAGALAIVWTIGAYAIVFGISLVMLSFRVRRIQRGG